MGTAFDAVFEFVRQFCLLLTGKTSNIHLHILQRHLRRGIIAGIQQYRQRREARDEQGYCGEEAEDGLEAVERRVHGADSPVLYQKNMKSDRRI